MANVSGFWKLGSAAALAVVVGAALAHGPGYGPGGFGGIGWGGCGGNGAGFGPGYGGCGAGPRGVAVSLLTRDEWIEHRNKMHSLQSYDECKAYVGEFNKELQERAKAKGTTAAGPNEWMCDRMRERGFFK